MTKRWKELIRDPLTWFGAWVGFISLPVVIVGQSFDELPILFHFLAPILFGMPILLPAASAIAMVLVALIGYPLYVLGRAVLHLCGVIRAAGHVPAYQPEAPDLPAPPKEPCRPIPGTRVDIDIPIAGAQFVGSLHPATH